MQNQINEDESIDPLWQLLPQAGEVVVDPDFSRKVTALASQSEQDASLPVSCFSAFASASAGWRAAAAAAIFMSASLVSLGIFGGPQSSSLETRIKIASTDAAVATTDYTNIAPAMRSSISPLDEMLAADELDSVLSIQDSEALDDEDLLILLFPDWELL